MRLALEQRAFQDRRMNETFGELAAALRERLAIIGDEESRRDPERHMQRLQEISTRLDQLEQQLPREIDPHLRHFLQRRSYSKALELIEATSANTTQRSTAR